MLPSAGNPHGSQTGRGSRNLSGSGGGCRSTSRSVEAWPAGGRAELRTMPSWNSQPGRFLMWNARRFVFFKVRFLTQTLGCLCAPLAPRGALRVRVPSQDKTLFTGGLTSSPETELSMWSSAGQEAPRKLYGTACLHFKRNRKARESSVVFIIDTNIPALPDILKTEETARTVSSAHVQAHLGKQEVPNSSGPATNIWSN